MQTCMTDTREEFTASKNTISTVSWCVCVCVFYNPLAAGVKQSLSGSPAIPANRLEILNEEFLDGLLKPCSHYAILIVRSPTAFCSLSPNQSEAFMRQLRY